METTQLKERYMDLYEAMSESGKPDKMKIFGKAEIWLFDRLLATDPVLAQEWLGKLEAVDWNNYLTRNEAEEITSKLVDKDGHSGPMWTYDQVVEAVAAAGGTADCYPYYNSHALFAVMNMLASDHIETLARYIPESDIAAATYMLAVDKLKDPDRKEFVRAYFSV